MSTHAFLGCCILSGVSDEFQVNPLSRLQWWEMQVSGPGDTLVWWISSVCPFRSGSPEPWEANLYWPLMTSDWTQSMGSTSRRLEGRSRVRFGYLLAQIPSNRFTMVWFPLKIRAPARQPSSHNNLYFKIPVTSFAPHLFGHGVIRVVFHSRDLCLSSWQFLLAFLHLICPHLY